MEAAEERFDVLGRRVAAQDVVGEPLVGAVVDDREDAERAVIQLVGRDVAREVGECPVEVFGLALSRRLFPPGLDPVLDRGVRDEHAVVAPQGPAGGAVGQAVLDHQSDGGVDDPAGVVAAGVSQVGHVGVEVPAALRAEVPGVKHDEVAGPSGEGVSEVVEGAAAPTIAVGTVPAARTGPAAIVAAAEADVGPGQVVDAGDALGGIGAVFAGSWHGEAPGRKDLPGDTPGGGKLFTRVARFPRYRVPIPRLHRRGPIEAVGGLGPGPPRACSCCNL